MQTSAELDVMMSAVRHVRCAMLDGFSRIQSLSIDVADAKAFVADIDQHVAQEVSGALIKAFPAYGLLMEGADELIGAEPIRRWIVDPMDGTANFENGLPHWAISIALEHKGQIIAAVVYDPFKDELFSATTGGGAWLNGQTRLHTSGKASLSQGTLSTGMPPSGSDNLPLALATLGALLNDCAGVRQLGAAVLDLAYVAAGRLDGYWNRNLKAWHFVAGAFLVQEAGGLVKPLGADPQGIDAGNIVGIVSSMFPEFDAAVQVAQKQV